MFKLTFFGTWLEAFRHFFGLFIDTLNAHQDDESSHALRGDRHGLRRTICVTKRTSRCQNQTGK